MTGHRQCVKCRRRHPLTRKWFPKPEGYFKHRCRSCDRRMNERWRRTATPHPPLNDPGVLIRCTKCRRKKPATQEFFVITPKALSGLSSRCRPCLAEDCQRWRRANPAAMLRSVNQWRRRHPELTRLYDRRKYAKRKGAGRTAQRLDQADLLELYRRQGGLCRYCSKSVAFEGMTLDHVIPLARGGVHQIENICLACPSCNARKWAFSVGEFFARTKRQELIRANEREQEMARPQLLREFLEGPRRKKVAA